MDYSKTITLPRQDFPMRANAAVKEPELIQQWAHVYAALREDSSDRERFILHDGPPYANGHIHIGHALNKVLKDIIVRSQQMAGKDAHFVPGWDCHGLPIEWEVEKLYRQEGRTKDDVPIIEFRQRCRAYARTWVDTQREEFKRLGINADWSNAYETMSFKAEAQIAREIMNFADRELLYRGSKPVLWSIAEGTSLAEAEVEYRDHTSDTIYVCFRLKNAPAPFDYARLVIYTTTPWTIPANRAIAFSPTIQYGLYRVVGSPDGNWASMGQLYVLADVLAEATFKAAKVSAYVRVDTVTRDQLESFTAIHPLNGHDVPVIVSPYVTSDLGTGLVHTAPSHGTEDWIVWQAEGRQLRERGYDTTMQETVGPDGVLTEATGFAGLTVFTPDGKPGTANSAVIAALVAADALIGRGRVKHAFPHSWRSRTPLITRSTAQWFIALDQAFEVQGAGPDSGRDLRSRALDAIETVEWIPEAGEKRIHHMVLNRPDWLVSRQRSWGVPITIFAKPDGTILHDDATNDRIVEAFRKEGADCWYREGAAKRFLPPDQHDKGWIKIDDVLDVWFDSGCTHTFGCPETVGLVMYLEGSDQHRGWFQSSLLEALGSYGQAPYDVVMTHGFVLDEKGRKMSKSEGNVIAPQDVIKTASADILRLWVAMSDYTEDVRVGPNVLQTFSDTYRKIRNTIRWMVGILGTPELMFMGTEMPELERYILGRLARVGAEVTTAYDDHDFKRVMATMSHFMNTELSGFYFDVRKDVLYCDPASSPTRKWALFAIERIFECTATWLAPILPFLADEAWTMVYPDDGSVHLCQFQDSTLDDSLNDRWEKIMRVRARATKALEEARSVKLIGAPLEAKLDIFLHDPALYRAVKGADFAEICICSAATVTFEPTPPGPDCPDGIMIAVSRAPGRKCARSWKYSTEVGTDPDFPDVTPRDAQALRERGLSRTIEIDA